MNKYLLSELQKMERSIDGHLKRIKADMESDPKSELLHIELEFQNFLAETKERPGARTTSGAMLKVDDLRRKQERQEERAKLWNHEDLSNDWIHGVAHWMSLNGFYGM